MATARNWLLGLVVLVAVGCTGPLQESPLGLGQTSHADETKAGSTVFKSPQGFSFVVPSGWSVSPFDSRVLVRKPEAAQNDGFLIGPCAGAIPQACLSNPEMPAKLVGTAETRMAGLPATTYVLERETAAQTRRWMERVTVIAAGGKTYAVGVMIPAPELTQEYLELYNQILASFHLTAN